MGLVKMTNKLTIRLNIFLLNFYSVFLRLKQGDEESRVTIRIHDFYDVRDPGGRDTFTNCFDMGEDDPFYVRTNEHGFYMHTYTRHKLDALMTIMDHFHRNFKIENGVTLTLKSADSDDNYGILLYASVTLGLQVNNLHWIGSFNNEMMFQDVVEIGSNILNVTIESDNAHDFTSGIANFRVGVLEIGSAHWFTRDNLLGLVNCREVALKKPQLTSWKIDSLDLNAFIVKFLADDYDLKLLHIVGIEDVEMSKVVESLDVVGHLSDGNKIIYTLRKLNGDLVVVGYDNKIFHLGM